MHSKDLQERRLKHCLLLSEAFFGAILSLLGKTVRLVAEHTWTLIVFAAALVDGCCKNLKKTRFLSVLITSMQWT